MAGILDCSEMGALVTLVEEAARSTEEGVKHFVEPAPGTLRRAVSKRHHIVFGRRGSGKSSLLHKAAADLTVSRCPIAYVNLEAFKGHSYPDVLLSVLISTFQEFRQWMDTAAVHPATRKSFWHKMFGSTPTRPPHNRQEASALAALLGQQTATLKAELHRTDDAELTTKSGTEASDTGTAGAQVQTGLPGAAVSLAIGVEAIRKDSQEVQERYKRSKIDFLHRHILEYQDIFRKMGGLSGGDSYLFLDDLYHIRRADQPSVVDYFHRVAKDHSLWLKIGSIRHRTRWYVHGDPPTGIKLGDDADEINLDVSLEKYSLARQFLASCRRPPGFAGEAVAV